MTAVLAATLRGAASRFYWDKVAVHDVQVRLKTPVMLPPPPHDSCRVSLAANSEDDWDLYLKTMPEKNENKKIYSPKVFKRLSSFCSIFLFFYDRLYFQPCFYFGFEISES